MWSSIEVGAQVFRFNAVRVKYNNIDLFEVQAFLQNEKCVKAVKTVSQYHSGRKVRDKYDIVHFFSSSPISRNKTNLTIKRASSIVMVPIMND